MEISNDMMNKENQIDEFKIDLLKGKNDLNKLKTTNMELSEENCDLKNSIVLLEKKKMN